ncbi:DUF5615 family PIN-like protein [Pararhodobacter sp. SW119]|uniref:DUF5615 family PIN-like protein n=1 Tax=Pararhodobacter sp. SW119 TaxID=2780075 RepID=UPI001ADFC542|nr:DUF5615 family PIN-like protein [Pararhodobacter sp. SW119]
MAPLIVIRFLLDNNVPDSVAHFLRERGHDVELVREIMASDAKDPVVAVAAIEAQRVLISWDKDFNHQRFQQPRFAALSRIGMSCPEPDGAARIAQLIDVVEFTYARANGSPILIRIARDKYQVRN